MNLNFKVYGAGPPLVICHGLFGMLDNWQTLARKWAEYFTVYAIDQRNHGRSEHSDDFSYPLLAEDLAQFMESQWIYKGFLLGHSMGGKTVMQTALDFPDMVEKMVVVDMGPSANKAGHQAVFEAMRSLPLMEIDSRKAAAEHLAQYLPERSTRQFLMKNLSRKPSGGFRWKMNLESLHKNYDEILAAMPEASYEGETCFIRGERSDYLPSAMADDITNRFPAARLVSIPAAGHWVHADQPELLFKTVLDFLQE